MNGRAWVHAMMLTVAVLGVSCAHEDSAHKNERPTGSAVIAPAPSERSPGSPDSGKPQEGGRNHELPQRLRAIHEAADRAVSPADKSRSAEVLLRVFEDTEKEQSPHLVSVRQDLAARAATLLLETSPEQAKAAARQGLALSEARTILRANLLLALADAEEALGEEKQAKTALMQALRINEELFESEMTNP